MSRDSVLARGRTAAEAGMVDTCTITRVTGSTTDQDTGDRVETRATPYTGKCRLQQNIAQADQRNVGQDLVLLVRSILQLPMSVTDLRVDDEVTFTASASDPDLPGRVFLIRDLFHKTDATARRVGVIERTSV